MGGSLANFMSKDSASKGMGLESGRSTNQVLDLGPVMGKQTPKYLYLA